jgi:riboflavin biosynthesis pyrimidine reductase
VRQLLPATTAEPDLERIYSFPAPGTGTYLRGNFVTSLDGAIEVGGRSGPLGGEGDHQIFHLLRGLADVVLVGAGTARNEGYGPARIPEARRDRRRKAGQLPVPPIAVVTRRGLDADSRLLQPDDDAPRPLVLTTDATVAAAPNAVRDRAEYIACGDDEVDLSRALGVLAERGLRRVICEGGPRLLTDLVVAGLLDELCLTLTPLLAGPGRAGMTAGSEWGGTRGFHLVSALEQDGELYLRYLRS